MSAFARGRVEAIASGISSGRVLLLNHGQGLMSYYSHLETVTVARGQAVDAGQSVGSTASTFLPWGPHLHWGVLLSGIPVNPRRFVAINYCSVPP